ncbi:hypothetical protein [Pseudolysinimonas sp.]|uniref:hypothetical protein n=1 Tax=Pseudolysinimonas sp. TaxID=2680009 RepID=UPI003F819DF0
MPDCTVIATFQVTTEADRAQVQALLDQGLRELAPIASRYGVTIRDGSATIEE